jgi:S-adenosylmethionine-diacylglycerol 3-amino-3-carboxypropyl transferase
MENINYSLCWEDQDMLIRALNISPDDDVLSITSGGCNTLALLLQRPHSITAIDNNAAQNYLLELKVAAIRALTYQDTLAFLGFKQSQNRLEQFQKIKVYLSPDALAWWEKRVDLINKGIVHAGKFERYLRLFRSMVLPLIHSKKTIKNIFALDSFEDQKIFWDAEWNNRRMRFLGRIFFSQPVMSRLGRSRERFAYSNVHDIGKYYIEKSRRVFVDIPTRNNYLLDYMLTGTYSSVATIPTYLREENFNILKNEVHKLKIVTSDLGKFLARAAVGSFSKFNLSDVFEAMSIEQADSVFKELARTGKKDGIAVFWDNLVHRQHPASLNEEFVTDFEKAKKLAVTDRAFLYSNFTLEKIQK